jgi:hypothetical protein
LFDGGETMRRADLLSVVILVALLLAPGSSLSAGGPGPSGPDAPATYNVELLSHYPGTFALAAVDGSQAFLGD